MPTTTLHAVLSPTGAPWLFADREAGKGPAPRNPYYSATGHARAVPAELGVTHPRALHSDDLVEVLDARPGAQWDWPEPQLIWLPATPNNDPATLGELTATLRPFWTPVATVTSSALLDLATNPGSGAAAGVQVAPSVRWFATAADALEPLLAAGLFLPTGDLEVLSKSKQRVHVGLRPWLTPAVTTLLDDLADSMPPALLAAHGQQTTARAAVDALAPSLLLAAARRALVDVAPGDPLKPMTSDLLLRAITTADQRQDWFAAKPTSAKVLAGLADWARQPEAGERAVLGLHLCAPEEDDAAADWTIEVVTFDAATPDQPRALSSLTATERGELLAPAITVWPALTTLTTDADVAAASGDPDRLPLPAGQVGGFLTRTAPALGAAGVTVVVPSWLRAATRTHVGISAHRAPSTGLFGLDSLLEAQLTVTVDGTDLSGDDLDTALTTGLVRTADGVVVLDDVMLRRLRKLGQETANGKLDARALLALRAEGVLDEAVSGGSTELADVVVTTNDAWVQRLLGGAAPDDLSPVSAPTRLNATLRGYQQDGLDWLGWLTRNGFGGILADDMGLGKTMQVLALTAAEHEGLVTAPWPLTDPTLIVVKPSGLQPWLQQPATFTPHLRVSHFTAGDHLEEVRAVSDIVLVTYDTLRARVEEFAAGSWHRVVLDEATKVKNPAAAVTKAVARLQSPQLLVLTGTPVENGLGDLHTLVSLANPGLLGSRSQFNARYANQIGGVREALGARETDAGPDAARADALTRLRNAYGPFYLSRRKDQYAGELRLGRKRYRTVSCGLTPEQVRLYDRMRHEAAARAAEDPRCKGTLNMTLLTRLQQVVNTPAMLRGGPMRGRSGKVAELDRLLDQIAGDGEKALVFTRFRQAAELLAEHLRTTRATPVYLMTGGVGHAKRLRDVAHFQASQGPAVFIITMGSGAEALDLTAARHVIHFDRWWNPAREEQANDRAYRPGQEADVTVHIMQCAGTIEERLADCLTGKRALAADVTGAAGSNLTSQLSRLSLEDLLAVTALNGPVHTVGG